METLMKSITTAICGLALYVCGLNWELLIIWFMLMTIDVITGNMKHAIKGNWCSSEMKIGLLKKAAEFFILATLILGQRVLTTAGISFPAGEIFSGIFAVKEMGSIAENCIQMGVKLPGPIMDWLKVAQDKMLGSKDDGRDA